MPEDKREYTEFVIEGMEEGYPGPDGKKNLFKLFYDYNLIVDAEVLTGYNLLQPLYSTDRMSAGQLRALAYAVLKTGHPQVTLKDAGDLLGKSEVAMNKVLEVLGMQSSDEAIFRAISRLAVERPLALVEMLSRAKPLIPDIQATAEPTSEPAEDA